MCVMFTRCRVRLLLARSGLRRFHLLLMMATAVQRVRKRQMTTILMTIVLTSTSTVKVKSQVSTKTFELKSIKYFLWNVGLCVWFVICACYLHSQQCTVCTYIHRNLYSAKNRENKFWGAVEQGLYNGTVSLHLSVRAGLQQCRFAAVNPAGRRYWSIAARPALSSSSGWIWVVPHCQCA